MRSDQLMYSDFRQEKYTKRGRVVRGSEKGQEEHLIRGGGSSGLRPAPSVELCHSLSPTVILPLSGRLDTEQLRETIHTLLSLSATNCRATRAIVRKLTTSKVTIYPDPQ